MKTLANFRRFTPCGHSAQSVTPLELVEQLTSETESAISTFAALPEGPIDSTSKPGFQRIAVTLPISASLFDALMNGESGYRAHYAASPEIGEDFNALLVRAIAPLILAADHLYRDKFTAEFCGKSIFGNHTKLWYSTAVSDPSASTWLHRFPEELRVPHWVTHWSGLHSPRKGLLAPMPEEPAVLLNGTFVNKNGEPFEQKPGRSLELHQTGWT